MRRDTGSGLGILAHARFVVALFLVAVSGGVLALGCGGASSGGGKGGAGGGAAGRQGGGAGAQAGAGGSDAGAGSGGSDAATDAPPEMPTADASADVAASDAADAAVDASAADVGADLAVEAMASDAGAGCFAPVGEAPLVPATEGLPATGLVLWLRGDRGIHKTAANAVCAWADQSGHETILARAAPRPTWAAAGVADNKPAVHFTATGQDLATGGVLGIAAQSARTYVVVTALVTPTKRFAAIIQGQAGTPGTYLSLDTNTFQTAGSREGVYAMNNAYDSTLATSTALRVHVYTMGTVGPLTVGTPVLPALDYRVNGVNQTLTRTPGGLGNGNFESFAGANFTSVGANAAEAFVAEVLVYDRALTVLEREAVEAALQTRYAIP